MKYAPRRQPKRSRTGLAAVVLALLIAPIFLAARADAYLYWHHDGPEWGIARANLDGSGVDERFINTCIAVPTGCGEVGYDVAVGAGYVYWVNLPYCSACPGGLGPVTIDRAKIDGSGVDRDFLNVPGGGIAVDAGHVYWADIVGGFPYIGRARIDGSGVDRTFIPALSGATDIAVDAGHVYWTNHWGIDRANIDGSGVDEDFIVTTPEPLAIAVDAGHIYWTTSNESLPSDPQGFQTISRARIDGSGVDRNFITGVATRPFTPNGIAVDAGHVYWTQGWRPGGPTGRPSIGRANIDGSGVDLRFRTLDDGVGYASGVAVDALVDTEPPETKLTGGAPKKTKKTTLKFKFKSSEPESSFECRLDEGKWKACSSPQKYRDLERGKYKFQVTATDAAGNEDPTAAKDKFKVVG